jgi:hypothetical protein
VPSVGTGPGIIGPAGLAPIAGGSPEAGGLAHSAGGPAGGSGGEGWAGSAEAVPYGELALVALVFAAASIFFGVFPTPLFHLAAHAGAAIGGIF